MKDTILPKWMTNILGFLLIIFIFVAILNQWAAFQGVPQTMQVTADAKITAIPDLATVTLGVTSTGNDPIEVKNQNNQKINQIMGFIKQQGIGSQDIKTDQLYFYPQYNYIDGERKAGGYQADQTLIITIKNIDKSKTTLEKILDGAVNHGANKIPGLEFGFMDMNQLKQLARKKAIQNAKVKAMELAAEADLKLGRVVNVLESSNASHVWSLPTMNFSAQAKSVAPKIEPGSQEIIENITLIFKVSS